MCAGVGAGDGEQGQVDEAGRVRRGVSAPNVVRGGPGRLVVGAASPRASARDICAACGRALAPRQVIDGQRAVGQAGEQVALLAAVHGDGIDGACGGRMRAEARSG